ncbi:hypothetical protein predicted by Glimmer/Critica (plasmid) [Salmonella enterica subsp. enterica serovar Weltevreden str. 2007-60-3289-1]|nr:hypothetical protein [Salmonella enterica subsp. enterica serovar Weltevreden]CBY98964.1 hypothetical protein predicted by Glimmer/Critica [Salmonella enterica subsp. enterica serovar Weltevreden str. 2007-60-3289-1]
MEASYITPALAEWFMVRKLERRFKNALPMKTPVRNAVMT